MGQEDNKPQHINLDDASEVKYWMRRLSITRSQVQTLAKTLNKPATDQPSKNPATSGVRRTTG